MLYSIFLELTYLKYLKLYITSLKFSKSLSGAWNLPGSTVLSGCGTPNPDQNCVGLIPVPSV